MNFLHPYLIIVKIELKSNSFNNLKMGTRILYVMYFTHLSGNFWPLRTSTASPMRRGEFLAGLRCIYILMTKYSLVLFSRFLHSDTDTYFIVIENKTSIWE